MEVHHDSVKQYPLVDMVMTESIVMLLSYASLLNVLMLKVV